MPCYHPIDAWRPDSYSGDKKLIFKYDVQRCGGRLTPDIKVPCGRCVGCRLERSRQWAMRCMHEAKMHKQNCFITLTYNEENRPYNDDLNYQDFQLFMKRLRERFQGTTIKFYMCGEYGPKLGRPHFHACLFGIDFPDRKLWKVTDSKSKLYRSEILEKLWTKGFSSVGDVNFESAAYVARYIMKKVTGEAAELHYTFCRSFNRGDISPPPRIHQNVVKARNRCYLVRKISH